MGRRVDRIHAVGVRVRLAPTGRHADHLGDGVGRAEEVDPVLPLRVANLFSGGYLYSVGTWMRCILDTFTHGEIEMSALPLTMDPKIPPKVAFGSRKVPVLGAVPQSLSASLSSL